DREVKLPLLTPFNSSTPKEIEEEVEQRLRDGFRTFKIKVGKDADADAKRVKAIQHAIASRATMRIDANRSYVEADASRFASSLDPSGIDLFEQPCHSDDWDANASVAKVSTVPIMLDEPICGLDDIERAADIPNVGYCKLKLKRFGSLDALKQALWRGSGSWAWSLSSGMVFQASCNAGWKAASPATSFAMPANSTDS